MRKNNLFLYIIFIFMNNYSMDDKSEKSRDSTLMYSTELNESTDFNFTPLNSPREMLTIPVKENTFSSCLKKLCCCFCCCYKKHNVRLVIEYDTIQ